MKKELRWYDYILINANWFALTTRSQTFTPLIIPLLVQQFVGDELKGTYFGQLRLWTLMVALLFQAMMGILSDHSTSRFGRRRPFIFVGAILEALFVLAIGFVSGMSGLTGYWVFFALSLLIMMGSNTAHAATQGLIPDLVPDEKKGIASGIKAFLELPIPLIFVAFVMGKMIERGELWGALITLATILIVSMLITMFVKEEPQTESKPIDWQPFIRLIAMTALFTLVILSSGYLVNLVLKGTDSTLLAGLAGLSGMLLAIIAGVWVSAKIGLGEEAKEKPSFIWWIVNRLAFMVGATNLASFLVFFLQEQFGFTNEQAAGPAANAVTFVGIAILVSALPGGWLSDKFGKKTLIVVAGLFATTGTAFVIFTPPPSMLGINIGAILIGLALGLFFSANWALGATLVPENQAGKFFGISNLAGAGAGAVGAYIGGPIADQHSYTLVIMIYGVIVLLSMFALLGIKDE